MVSVLISCRHSKSVKMALPFSPLTILFLSLSFSSVLHYATARKPSTPHDLVHSSCVHASYPNLCIRTLSSYAGPAKTPRDLAQASVKVSLARARKVSDYLTQVAGTGQGGKREKGALRDCVEQISDSVDDLSKTLSELQHLRAGTFRWQMSNVETWVSAALTNEDTCLDGFQGVASTVKTDVRRKITNVARVTSNALYLITRLESSRGRPIIDP